jgi:proline iminopeptidase
VTKNGDGHMVSTQFGHIHYEVVGSGSPIVVVPGGPGSSHSKDPQLAEHNLVIYFDPLGTGKSDRLENRSRYTVGLYADTILALLDHLSIAAAHVLGASFGGVPAAEFAARYPQRTLSLVLSQAQVDAEGWQLGNIDGFNAHVRNQYPEVWAQIVSLRSTGVRSGDPRYQSLLSEATRRMLWAGLDPMPVPLTPGESFDEATYLAFIGDDPDWSIEGTLRGHTVLERLAPHKLPTLVINGRRDLMSTPAIGKRIVDALDPIHTKHVVFGRSAHRPWAEEPTEYFALLRDFFAAHSVDAPTN